MKRCYSPNAVSGLPRSTSSSITSFSFSSVEMQMSPRDVTEIAPSQHDEREAVAKNDVPLTVSDLASRARRFTLAVLRGAHLMLLVNGERTYSLNMLYFGRLSWTATRPTYVYSGGGGRLLRSKVFVLSRGLEDGAGLLFRARRGAIARRGIAGSGGQCEREGLASG